MYAYTFLYPRPSSTPFGYEHLVNVHLPLGLGFVNRYLGIQPDQVWVERIGEGEADSSEPYAAVVHLLFASKDDRDRMPEIANYSDAKERLFGDYANYTDSPAQPRMSHWTPRDVQSAIDLFNAENPA